MKRSPERIGLQLSREARGEQLEELVIASENFAWIINDHIGKELFTGIDLPLSSNPKYSKYAPLKFIIDHFSIPDNHMIERRLTNVVNRSLWNEPVRALISPFSSNRQERKSYGDHITGDHLFLEPLHPLHPLGLRAAMRFAVPQLRGHDVRPDVGIDIPPFTDELFATITEMKQAEIKNYMAAWAIEFCNEAPVLELSKARLERVPSPEGVTIV